MDGEFWADSRNPTANKARLSPVPVREKHVCMTVDCLALNTHITKKTQHHCILMVLLEK